MAGNHRKIDHGYLVDTYIHDVGRITDAAHANRNRFIEWALLIVAAVIFGVLIAPNIDIFVAWLASAFLTATLLALFSAAVIQHGYLVRYNRIRLSILDYLAASDADEDKRFEYAKLLAEKFDAKRLCDRERGKLIKEVFLLGFGYLLVPSVIALVWFSYLLLISSIPAGMTLRAVFVTSCNPIVWNGPGILSVVSIVAVALVILRETRFLWKTYLLKYEVIPEYDKWVAEQN